ncbi:PREDICTED: putative GPI-anchored protein PB15E9.01c isoform X1 [Acropora digitifera]|uniref:putative GPI-anchored protein PB15E9.01c isoform X1 n=1 Tax=Acropora digitifera TaxID=70779 RepID=UPI00077A10F3|nr:PREDICTED: putative GPI-anchored protein PB15E9.01c isoform X1 [Acropora digitifera]
MATMYTFYRFWLCVLWIAPRLWTVVASESGNPSTTIMHQPSQTVNNKSMITSSHKSSSLPSVSILPTKTSKMSSHITTVSPNKTSPMSAATSLTVTLSFNSTVLPSGSVTTSPSQNRTVMPIYNTTVMPTSHIKTLSFNSTVLPSQSVTTSSSQNGTVMPIHNTTVMPTQNMTIMPSSAHSVVPTSTVHPTPPAPERGNFSVKDKNDTVCLVTDMAAMFDVEIKSKKMTIRLPTNATASGECDENHNNTYITLGWNSKEGSCNFTMYFSKFGKDVQSERWAAGNLTFSLLTTVGSNEAAHYTFSSKGPLKQLSAKVGHSYQCFTSTINLNLTGVNSSLVKVSMDKIDFQPYVKNGKRGEAENCETRSTQHPSTTSKPTKPTKGKPSNHAVAIAVGCSLAGLVLIVVIGYLIGRRRSRNVAAGYRKL